MCFFDTDPHTFPKPTFLPTSHPLFVVMLLITQTPSTAAQCAWGWSYPLEHGQPMAHPQ